jgi:calcium-dependent protein kinase
MQMDPVAAAMLKNEIDVMRYLTHPSIIKLHRIYEDPHQIALVMDLANKDLSVLIREKFQYTEFDAARLLENLLDAISYLHMHNIIHRDIKLDNILLPHADND